MENFKVDIAGLDFARRNKINDYLFELLKLEGSSLHIKSGGFIYARIGSEIKRLSDEIFTQQDGIILAKELLRTRFHELVEKKSVDFTHRLDNAARFRVNIFFQLEGVSVVFRLIPNQIPTLKDRFLPPVIENICDTVSGGGLVLVTGQPGSGKSTTVASMIDRINSTKQQHIITIENPIKFIYQDNKSIISQRAIGQDALSFDAAIRDALREDPNVIYVSEIRDLETIKACLLAAQNKILVIGILSLAHIRDAIKFLTKLFPAQEQEQAKILLCKNIQAAIAQKTVKALDNTKRTASAVLINTPTMKDVLLNGDDDEIYDAIESGKDTYGMQTFDQHLFDMYLDGTIDQAEALENASNKTNLENKIKNASLLKNDIQNLDDLDMINQLKYEI